MNHPLRLFRPFVFVLYLLAVTTSLSAQSFYCDYYGHNHEVMKPIKGFVSIEQARSAMGRIASVIGLKPNFEIIPGVGGNAAAVIQGQKRFIIYNPEFINRITKATRTDWSAFSILAHEIGHHLNGHTLEYGGSRHSTELEADEFSGFIMYKLGASLNQSIAAIDLVASPQATSTHPGKYERIAAIERGWLKAEAEVPKGYGVVSEPTFDVPEQNPDDAVFYVKVNPNPSTIFYMTNQNEFVSVNQGEKSVLGQFQAIGNGPYLYQITYKGGAGKLYVDHNGRLLNRDGKIIGSTHRLRQ